MTEFQGEQRLTSYKIGVTSYMKSPKFLHKWGEPFYQRTL